MPVCSYPEATSTTTASTPGTWRGGRTPEGRTALFCCPMCGKIASLSNHDIGVDGEVSPSVVCPSKTCVFHAFIRLEGWKP